MTDPLVIICANKVRIERKTIVEPVENKCKYECSGFNDQCDSYIPMVLSGYDELVKRRTIRR